MMNDGLFLSGLDGHNHFGLRRTNTYTTYVSVRKNANCNYGVSTKNPNFRSDHSSKIAAPSQRHLIHLEIQQEESI